MKNKITFIKFFCRKLDLVPFGTRQFHSYSDLKSPQSRKWNTLDDNNSKSFSNLIEARLKDFNGMIFSNEGRSLIGWLKRSIGLLNGRLSRSTCALLVLFSKKIYSIYQSQGRKGLVLWLKVSHILIQQSIAGDRIKDMTSLKMRVKRARTGLPQWIPQWQRRLLMEGHPRTIRFWTSLVALYRVIDFPGSVNLGTIIESSTGTKSLRDESESINWFWKLLNLPKWRELWILQKFNPFPIGTSGPLDGWSKDDISTSWHSVMRSAYALMTSHQRIGIYMSYYATGTFLHTKFFATLGAAFREACERLPMSWLRQVTFSERRRWWDTESQTLLNSQEMGSLLNTPGSDEVFDTSKGIFKYPDSTLSKRFVDIWLSEALKGDKPVYLGKLGLKPEPAGKIRVFAMVDSWTQWLFHPLHKLIQDILRGIPEDCTFDQIGRVEAKIKAVMAKNLKRPKAFSYDLSSATDRLPIWLQVKLLIPLMGELAAVNWAKVLTERRYLLPKSIIDDFDFNSVAYAVGQPMGALSSWVLLALTHHFLVQYSAYRAGVLGWRNKWFTDYAILGDDIVIFNSKVAATYYIVMTQELKVGINLSKSISSRKRLVLEFAKKFWVDGVRCFMLPVRDVIVATLSTQVMKEFIDKHDVTLNHYLSIRGIGYRARSKVGGNLWNMSSRLRLYLVVYSSHRFFLDWISMKSLTTNYDLSRSTIWSIAEELYKDHKALLHRLEKSRIPKEGSPWIWSMDLHKLMKFPRFLSSFILLDLMPKRAEFREILDRWTWILGRFELGLKNRNCSDEFLRDMLTDMIVSLEEAGDEADKYSLLTWYSQTRQEDKPFSRFISQYKRWVKYNGIVVKGAAMIEKPYYLTGVTVKVLKFPGLELPEEEFFKHNWLRIWTMALINWPLLSYLPLVWFQIKRFLFSFCLTWCILWWSLEEPLGGAKPHDPGIPDWSLGPTDGDAGSRFNVFDVFLAMILGAWLVVLVYGLVLHTYPAVEALSSMLRERLEWVGEEIVETPEIRVVSEFRFPNYRELIEWSNQRVTEGTTRSPQIGHGWTEYSPVNWDWPDTWR